MTGARPNSAARLSPMARQPATTSRAGSPGASTSRSGNRLASFTPKPWAGPGLADRGPWGWAQRGVERVDRPVALGGGDQPLVAHEQLDRGLGEERLRAALLGDHAERFEGEEVLLPSRGAAEQELEAAVGGLEVVAAVLEL